MKQPKFQNYGGWDWIRDQMENCPYCHQKPDLEIDALNDKHVVCCMNCSCGNMRIFRSDYWGEAIVAWNKWVREQVRG